MCLKKNVKDVGSVCEERLIKPSTKLICKACKFICKIPLQQKLRHLSGNVLPVLSLTLSSPGGLGSPLLLPLQDNIFLWLGKAEISHQCLTVEQMLCISPVSKSTASLDVVVELRHARCQILIVLAGIRLPLLDPFHFHQLVGIVAGIWGLQMCIQPKRKRAKFKGTLLNSVPGARFLFS